MNQILSLDNEWNKNNRNKNMNGRKGPTDIKKIIIIFSIILIIFGIGIIAKALYDISNTKEDTSNLSKPMVTMEINSETGMLDITIKHDRAIDKVIYSWNGENETEIAGRNRNLINESIEIPEGESKLVIKIVDVTNVSVQYEKEYTGEEIVKAQIELTQGEGAVKLVAKSQETISYITYQWNDANEERLEVENTEYETTIQVPQGENTLKVVAVGESGTETVETITVQGIRDEKPTLNVSIDAENFIITATDDEGIEKVIIRANGEDTTIDVGSQNFEYKVPFIDGYNEVRIKVYNINGLTTSTKATLTK